MIELVSALALAKAALAAARAARLLAPTPTKGKPDAR